MKYLPPELRYLSYTVNKNIEQENKKFSTRAMKHIKGLNEEAKFHEKSRVNNYYNNISDSLYIIYILYLISSDSDPDEYDGNNNNNNKENSDFDEEEEVQQTNISNNNDDNNNDDDDEFGGFE